MDMSVFPPNGTNPVTGKPYKYAVVMDNLVYAGSEEEKQANAQFDMFTDRRPATSKQWTLKNQETGAVVRGPTSNATGKAGTRVSQTRHRQNFIYFG